MPDEPDEFANVGVLTKYQILADRRAAAERRAGVRQVRRFSGFEERMPLPLTAEAPRLADQVPLVRHISGPGAGPGGRADALRLAALAEAGRSPGIPQDWARAWRSRFGPRRQF